MLMSSKLTMLMAACCASVAVAQPPDTRSTSTTTTVQYHRVSTVVGTSFTLGTESVGKVTDVVMNDGGCIEYLIVQDGEGFIAVPWSAATVNYEQKTVVVQSTTVTVEKLRELRFTQDKWPNFADATYSQRVQGVWGTNATRSGSGARTNPGPSNPKGGTAPPAKEKPTTIPPKSKDSTKDEPPAKDTPKSPPKKEKDKDGK
jgi:PRC-barrel domain